MIFAGFIPVVYMVLMGLLFFLSAYLIVKLKYNIRKIIPIFLLIGLSLLTALVISSPQVLSSLTLSRLSSRFLNLDFDIITAYPFSFNNMLNFIFPYAFGNPKYGTYPPFSNDWGIFWENTPYVGPIVIFLSLVSFLYAFSRKSNDKRFLAINLMIIIFFLLLVLGKYSPLYFLFELPPFNLFRTQARFLMMVCFFLFLTLGLALNNLYTKTHSNLKIIIILLLTVNLFDLVSVQKNYHLFIDAEKILDPPIFESNIKTGESYVTLGQAPYWNNIFIKSGWKSDTETEKYIFYRNFLFPNANLLYGKKIYDIANGLGFKPRRNEYLKSFLQDHITNSQNDTFPLQNTKNLITLLGIKYVIAPWKISDTSIEKISEKKLDDESIYLYDFLPSKQFQSDNIYSPSSVKLISTLADFEALFNNNNDFTNNAIIESPIKDIIDQKADFEIIKNESNEDSLEITADFKKKGLIVFRKNFYPGWIMKIDNQVTRIEKINLVHMGVFMSEGKHTIKLYYQNPDFEKGIKIATTTFAFYSVLIFIIIKLNKKLF